MDNTQNHLTGSNVRRTIYYWKCDRPAAFHGTSQSEGRGESRADMRSQVEALLERRVGSVPADLRAGGGQGNHLIYRATIADRDCLIRIEDGPERDDYMEVEADVIGRVRASGVPSWHFIDADSSRTEVPFAWQIVERVSGSDLNQLLSAGTLDLPAAAEAIGTCVGKWQSVRPQGYGPFQPDVLRSTGELVGFHASYESYFTIRLEAHIRFLAERSFLSAELADAITAAIAQSTPLLDLEREGGGCLVHKDLALWNVIGEAPAKINAVIDWDDTVSGDPMDDLSLLACFYDGTVLERALEGYRSQRELPQNWLPRFWLHLLRNMLWKSVIRVGSGYFDISDSKGFFLTTGSGQSGSTLRDFTLARIETALRGLKHSNPITSL